MDYANRKIKRKIRVGRSIANFLCNVMPPFRGPFTSKPQPEGDNPDLRCGPSLIACRYRGKSYQRYAGVPGGGWGWRGQPQNYCCAQREWAPLSVLSAVVGQCDHKFILICPGSLGLMPINPSPTHTPPPASKVWLLLLHAGCTR